MAAAAAGCWGLCKGAGLLRACPVTVAAVQMADCFLSTVLGRGEATALSAALSAACLSGLVTTALPAASVAAGLSAALSSEAAPLRPGVEPCAPPVGLTFRADAELPAVLARLFGEPLEAVFVEEEEGGVAGAGPSVEEVPAVPDDEEGWATVSARLPEEEERAAAPADPDEEEPANVSV